MSRTTWTYLILAALGLALIYWRRLVDTSTHSIEFEVLVPADAYEKAYGDDMTAVDESFLDQLNL